MSRKSTSPAVDGNSLGEAEQANAGVVHHALHSLTEADALLVVAAVYQHGYRLEQA